MSIANQAFFGVSLITQLNDIREDFSEFKDLHNRSEGT